VDVKPLFDYLEENESPESILPLWKLEEENPSSWSIVSLSEKGKIEDIAEKASHDADTEGITGFMYGTAVSILAKFWKHGEELRKWHNAKYKKPEISGVVNPAIMTIEIKLNGTISGSHPAELSMNSMVEGGATVVSLNPVDVNGNSSTLVTTHTYEELNAFDGFIKVMKSSSERDIILAQGDIGGNILTSNDTNYALNTVDEYQVSGTALFQERVNGNTLVTISLNGTIAGQTYPASINLSSTSTIGGGPVTKLLSAVNGTTGKSYTNIRSLDAGLAITYENWLVYNGYINIYQTSIAFDNIICQGDIGSN